MNKVQSYAEAWTSEELCSDLQVDSMDSPRGKNSIMLHVYIF